MSLRVESKQSLLSGTKSDAESDSPKSSTVLIVDDDASVRRSFRRLISTLRMDSIEADSGVQALQILSQTSVDVIICDVQMPLLDGISVYHALSAPMQKRLLLLSGHDSQPLAPDGVPILHKPVPWKTLEMAILDILGR